MNLHLPRNHILTIDCPDRPGVVAAVAGFLAAQHANIAEARHHIDAEAQRSSMRTAFHDDGGGMPALDELRAAFAPVADRFGMRWALHDGARRCRVLVAVSRQGHCLNSLLHRWSNGTLEVDVAGVVSNHEDMRRLAEWHGLPFHHLPIDGGDKRAQEQRLLALFDALDGELLVLARYMQILSDEACRMLAGRAINIHHSFLPSFKGARPYHQAHARGVKLIGATAHYVTPDLDEGPIIEQDVERVDHAVTAADMVAIGHDIESVVLNRAVRWHAQHRVFVHGSRTIVLR
jgi:formyltetrahydrofolate deformylase